MGNRRLSSARLAEENEPTFRLGIFDPLGNTIQEIFACTWNTAPLIAKSPAPLVWQFSD
jgi:hypothetical protein